MEKGTTYQIMNNYPAMQALNWQKEIGTVSEIARHRQHQTSRDSVKKITFLYKNRRVTTAANTPHTIILYLGVY
jgi:hypothetical protein